MTYQAQAREFLTKTGTTFSARQVRFGYHFSDDTEKRSIFKVTLSNARHSYTFEFGASIKDPSCTPYDVLTCLSSSPSYADMSFQEFCDEFGYGSDSIKNHDLWERCVKEGQNVIKLFGNCLEDLYEIQ